MIQLAEKPRKLAVQQKDECGNLEYFESPMLFKSGSKWYLTYVAYKDEKGPSCDRKGSYVEYAMADSMSGPFDAPARHLIYPSAAVRTPLLECQLTIAIRIHRLQVPSDDRERSYRHLAMVIVVGCDVVVRQVIRQIHRSRYWQIPCWTIPHRRLKDRSGVWRERQGPDMLSAMAYSNVRSLTVAGGSFFHPCKRRRSGTIWIHS